MEEAWELATLSEKKDIYQVPRVIGCNRSPDYIELTVSDGRILAIPLHLFPKLKEATDEEWEEGKVLPLGEGVNWANLDIVIRAEDEFVFEQDLDKLKPHSITRAEILNFEIKQPNNVRLSDREHRYASDAIEAFVRSETNTSLYIAASFAPVLLLFSLLQGRESKGIDIPEITGLIAIIFLSISGVFFSYYRAIISTKRNLIEGYKLGLLESYWVEVFPKKKTLLMNSICLLGLIPLGYLFVALTMFLLVL